MNLKIQNFWQAYLDSLPANSHKPETMPPYWHFTDNEPSANHLAELTLVGTKRATAGALWSYEAEGEATPQPGDLSIIIDWDENPVCLIETLQVDITPFHAVDEDFARTEGEGDGSLTYWKDVHWQYFSREMAAIGRQAHEDMPVVCERFRVIFPQKSS
jgi:uncharacterized protein YhfF